MAIEHASATAARRGASEDRLAIVELRAGLAIVLADGAGGMSGGARAAEMAVALATREIDATFGDPFALVALLARMDREVHADPAAGEATIVIVTLGDDRIAGASAGDSEAWLVDDVEIDDLTVDQHRKRRIGSACAEPVSFVRPSLDRRALLVASDGLFAFTSRSAIASTLRAHRPVDETTRALIDLARSATGRLGDDVALALARSASIDAGGAVAPR
jgi:serine/threonine protein phosphatase PrpC